MHDQNTENDYSKMEKSTTSIILCNRQGAIRERSNVVDVRDFTATRRCPFLAPAALMSHRSKAKQSPGRWQRPA